MRAFLAILVFLCQVYFSVGISNLWGCKCNGCEKGDYNLGSDCELTAPYYTNNLKLSGRAYVDQHSVLPFISYENTVTSQNRHLLNNFIVSEGTTLELRTLRIGRKVPDGITIVFIRQSASLVAVNVTFSSGSGYDIEAQAQSNNILVNTVLKSINMQFASCSNLLCAAVGYASSGIECSLKNNNMGVQCTSCSIGMYLEENTSSYTCTSCLPGQFADEHGGKECSRCPPGKFQDRPQKGSCQSCISGRYSSALRSICFDVPPGSYANNCTARNESHNYTSMFECSEITPCNTGAFCTGGNTAMQLCPPGRYQEAMSSTSCNRIPPGKFGSKCVTDRYSGCQQATTCTSGYSCKGGEHRAAICDPGHYSGEGEERCTKCIPGTFNPESNASTCFSCAPGLYSGSEGQTSCEECSPGKFSEEKSTFCQICLAGDYIDYTFDPPQCRPCPSGKYSEAAAKDCSDCPAGRYTKQDIMHPMNLTYKTSSGCFLCLPGRWSTSVGATLQASCKNCTKGTFSNSRGAGLEESCMSCQPGKYSIVEGATSEAVCQPCPEGKYCKDNQVKTCNPGHYSMSGESACTSCELGTFAVAEGSTKCKPCVAGTYQDARGQQGCKQCPSNTYSDKIGNIASEQCFMCEQHKTTNGKKAQTGAQACVCAGALNKDIVASGSQGYFEAGPKGCQECPNGANCSLPGHNRDTLPSKKGFWRSSTAETEFHLCKLGVLACRGGAIVNDNPDSQCDGNRSGALCSLCKEDFALSNNKCIFCEEGRNSNLIAFVAGFSLVLYLVFVSLFFIYNGEKEDVQTDAKVANSFWKLMESWTEFTQESSKWIKEDEFIRIYDQLYSHERTKDLKKLKRSLTKQISGIAKKKLSSRVSRENSDLIDRAKYRDSKLISIIERIKINYENYELGYEEYLKELANGGTFSYRPEDPSRFQKYCSCLKWCQITPKSRREWSRKYRKFEKYSSPLAKIALEYMQIVTAMTVSYNVDWPEEYLETVRVMKFANFDFFDPIQRMLQRAGGDSVCFLHYDFISKFYLHMAIVPIIVVTTLILWFIVLRVTGKSHKNKILSIFVFIIPTLQPGLCSRIFSIFKCTSYGLNGEGTVLYLEQDHSIICGSERHANAKISAWISIVIYVMGIPFLMGVVLWQFRQGHVLDEEKRGQKKCRCFQKLVTPDDDERGDDKNGSTLTLRSDAVSNAYGSLYDQYTDEYWYFEIGNMIKQIILAGALIVLTNKALKLFLGVLVNVFYLVVLSSVNPYNSDVYRWLQTYTSACLVFAFLIGLSINVQSSMTSSRLDETVFGSLIVSTNILFYFVVVFVIPYIIFKRGRVIDGVSDVAEARSMWEDKWVIDKKNTKVSPAEALDEQIKLFAERAAKRNEIVAQFEKMYYLWFMLINEYLERYSADREERDTRQRNNQRKEIIHGEVFPQLPFVNRINNDEVCSIRNTYDNLRDKLFQDAKDEQVLIQRQINERKESATAALAARREKRNPHPITTQRTLTKSAARLRELKELRQQMSQIIPGV